MWGYEVVGGFMVVLSGKGEIKTICLFSIKYQCGFEGNKRNTFIHY